MPGFSVLRAGDGATDACPGGRFPDSKKKPGRSRAYIAMIRGRERSRWVLRCRWDQNVMRGPTKNWVSPSENLTSPLMPQVGLNFTCAPTRP